MIRNLFSTLLLATVLFETFCQGCVDPPAMANTKIIEKAEYQCLQEYVSCSDTKRTSVLQPSGEWQVLPDMCGKYIYYNLQKFTTFIAPCGAADYIQFKLVVEQKEDTKGTLTVMGGSDLLFTVGFRLNEGETVLNTNFNGQWGHEIRLKSSYLKVGQASVIIVTYIDGCYNLEVDGTVVYTFPERAPGIKPDGIQVGHDMVTYSLTMLIDQ